jgi:uncharacterized DUF497 family protein
VAAFEASAGHVVDAVSTQMEDSKECYTKAMEFEWDDEKNATNLQKHGISFEEGATVFGDALSDTFDDPDHCGDENRFLTIGGSDKGRLLVVTHADRDDRIRIISARELTAQERRSYEEGTR